MSETPTDCRRFQFSLRTLFVVVTLICVACAIGVPLVHRLNGPTIRAVKNGGDWLGIKEEPQSILFVDCPWNSDIVLYRSTFSEFAAWCRVETDIVPYRVELDSELRTEIAILVEEFLTVHQISTGTMKTMGGAGRIIWMEKGQVKDYAFWQEVPNRRELIRRTQFVFSPPIKTAN